MKQTVLLSKIVRFNPVTLMAFVVSENFKDDNYRRSGLHSLTLYDASSEYLSFDFDTH